MAERNRRGRGRGRGRGPNEVPPLTDDELREIDDDLRGSGVSPRDFNLDFGDRWRGMTKRWQKFAGMIETTRVPDIECMTAMGILDDVRTPI